MMVLKARTEKSSPPSSCPPSPLPFPFSPHSPSPSLSRSSLDPVFSLPHSFKLTLPFPPLLHLLLFPPYLLSRKARKSLASPPRSSCCGRNSVAGREESGFMLTEDTPLVKLWSRGRRCCGSARRRTPVAPIGLHAVPWVVREAEQILGARARRQGMKRHRGGGASAAGK